jgi:hypothetical protein
MKMKCKLGFFFFFFFAGYKDLKIFINYFNVFFFYNRLILVNM